MTIDELLATGRLIWGEDEMILPEIIAAMGVVFGDICRWQRDRTEPFPARSVSEELAKELGNMILSTIRWADDLGYRPEQCIRLAIEAQRRFRDHLKQTG